MRRSPWRAVAVIVVSLTGIVAVITDLWWVAMGCGLLLGYMAAGGGLE